GSVTNRSSAASKSLIVVLPLVEFRHGYRLGPRPARPTHHRVLDDQPLGPAPLLGPVYLQQERTEPRVVLADTTGTEPAAPAGGLGAEPAKQEVLLTLDAVCESGESIEMHRLRKVASWIERNDVSLD